MISKVQVQNDYIKQMIVSGLSTNTMIGINCLICDEFIELGEQKYVGLKYGKDIVKVCPKCKQAVMKIRKEMEEHD